MNSERGLSYILGQTSFTDLHIILLQKVVKRLRRHSVSAFKGVNVDVRCRNIGVSEPCRYGFYIAAVGKEHGRTCVAKPVKLQVTDTVSFQKVVELLCRCVRIHHVAILLGEHIVEISPTVAEVSCNTP